MYSMLCTQMFAAVVLIESRMWSLDAHVLSVLMGLRNYKE